MYPLLLLAVLVFCGGGDAMAKVFEETGQRAWDGMYFLILFAAAACLTLVLLLAEKKRSGKKVIGKEFAAGFLVGIPVGYQLLQIMIYSFGDTIYMLPSISLLNMAVTIIIIISISVVTGLYFLGKIRKLNMTDSLKELER